MFCWRISKYNIKDSGFNEEWTSISDIGKRYNGIEFTFEEYLTYENLYVKIVFQIMDKLSVKALSAYEIEKGYIKRFNDIEERKQEELFSILTEKTMLTGLNLELLIRLILREVVWCKLKSNNMFVHFGYDYYMYIGCTEDIYSTIATKDLNITEFESPYYDSETDELYDNSMKKDQLINSIKSVHIDIQK